MEKTKPDSETRVDLYVRPDGRSLWSHQQTVIDHVESMSADGVVDYHRIQFWPREVSLAGPMANTSYHSSAAETVDEFLEWASEAGRPVYSFDSEIVESEMTGETHSVLHLPACCLAVYEEDELVGVFPHRNDDSIVTVEDALARLEEDGRITDGSDRRSPSPAASNSN